MSSARTDLPGAQLRLRRVEAPHRLAEILLSDPDRWNPESLEAIVASGKTEVVHLPHPVPIVLLCVLWLIRLEGETACSCLRHPIGPDTRMGVPEFRPPEGIGIPNGRE